MYGLLQKIIKFTYVPVEVLLKLSVFEITHKSKLRQVVAGRRIVSISMQMLKFWHQIKQNLLIIYFVKNIACSEYGVILKIEESRKMKNKFT